MSKDSTLRLLGVAFCLCLVCSVLVSVAAVGLKDRQESNKMSEKRRNILQIAGLYEPGRSVEEQFEKVKTRIIDLEKGRFADPSTSDVNAVEKGGTGRYSIPADKDSAGIRSRPRFVEAYLVTEKGRLQQIILPVYGKGLWSTMYGFIALGPDLSTVRGFGFYEHGETPGLGGEIDNPAWRGKWPGKMVYDKIGNLRIEVVKGAVDATTPGAEHKVDGISGATLTARGVSNLLNYWLGENGYQPFLHNLRKSGEVAP
ncbi:MAG: Na(+)-translocating NADH-quinone reductase subunit C [Desulfuromonadaceae bacterium]